MKRLLPFAFILFAACSKESAKPITTNGIVKYSIEGDTVEIVDSTSHSVARWVYSSTTTKGGYGLQAYIATPGGIVSSMISFYIKTDKIEPNHHYSKEVTRSILTNSAEYVSSQDLEGTYIQINISKQQDQTFTGTFTGRLNQLNTNKFVEISGTFDKVKLIK